MSLTVSSSTVCEPVTLPTAGMVTVGSDISFETDFNGVLCNGQEIILTNNSFQSTGFSWDIQGALNPIYSDNSATFAYDEDQEGVIWTLNYVSDECNQSYSDTVDVNVDLIEVSYTCLLYTSPSPRDGLLSRMPSSA